MSGWVGGVGGHWGTGLTFSPKLGGRVGGSRPVSMGPPCLPCPLLQQASCCLCLALPLRGQRNDDQTSQLYPQPSVTHQVADEALTVLERALALQGAGCFSLVLECVPAPIAAAVTRALKIPTIGIGAGPATSGQVRVWGAGLRL